MSVSSSFRGNNLSVVVIDSGRSQDLVGVPDPVFGFDFADQDSNVINPESLTHGELVAFQVVQAAPEIDLIHLKVFGDGAESAFDSDIEEALNWVLTHSETYNVVSVNLSVGSGRELSSSESRLSDEIVALSNQNIGVIVAAGNNGGIGINEIAATDGAIGVGSVDENGERSDFSQESSQFVDLYAQGEGLRIEDTSGQAYTISGTSFAAPTVAGAYAIASEISLQYTGERITEDQFLNFANLSGDPAVNAVGGAVIDIDALSTQLVEFYTANTANTENGAVIQSQIAFDSQFYLRENTDVLQAVLNGSMESAQFHYINHGRFEGRDPSELFDTSFYLETYQDVAAAGVNPLDHFNVFGLNEGRLPKAADDGLILA